MFNVTEEAFSREKLRLAEEKPKQETATFNPFACLRCIVVFFHYLKLRSMYPHRALTTTRLQVKLIPQPTIIANR